MEEQVVAPDVDDERDRRSECRDIRKILVGSDADVRSAFQRGAQRGNDVQVRFLIRNQVVGIKIAAGFG